MDADRFDGMTKRITRGGFLRVAGAVFAGAMVALRRRGADAYGYCSAEYGWCSPVTTCCTGSCQPYWWGWGGYCIAPVTQPVAEEASVVEKDDAADAQVTTEKSGKNRKKRKDKDSRGNGQWHETDKGDGGNRKPIGKGPRGHKKRELWGERQFERRVKRDRV